MPGSSQPGPARSREADLQAVHQEMVDGLLIAEVSSRRLVHANGAMCRMLGYSEKELHQLTVDDIHPGAELPRVHALFESLGRNECDRATGVPCLRKDGSVLCADLVARVQQFEGRDCIAAFFRDATERSQAQKALAESEARFRAVFQAAPLGIALADLRGTILECNEQLAQMLGYEPEELKGRPIAEITLADDLPRERSEIGELKTGALEARQIEKRYVHKSGAVVWGRLSASLMRDASGAPQYVVGVVENVTERKRVELERQRAADQLRESEHRYRLVVENATDIIWTARLDVPGDLAPGMGLAAAAELVPGVLGSWRFTYVSPSVERVLGYHADDAVRLTAEQFLTPAAQVLMAEALAEELMMEQDPASDPDRRHLLEVEMVTKHGSVRWCEVSTTFLRDEGGHICGLLGATRDVSERKTAENALRESESTFRTLVANLPDLVLLVDENAILLFANRDAPGATVGEMLGRSGFGFVAPEFQNAARDVLRQVLATREVAHLEMQDVFEHWFSCRLVPVVEGERVASVMLICTDITVERLAADAIRREQELLRHLLDVSERDRELVAFEIHDGFAQLLTGAHMQFESAVQCTPIVQKDARLAFDAGLRLLRESIEESRRLVAGLRPPALDEFGVGPAVERLISDSRQEGGQDIEFVAPDDLPRLDRPLETALFRIVQESLTNAQRHSGSDRVRVELSCGDGRIGLSVRDWGIGFDPAQVPSHRFGLKGIRERARLLGGRAEIDSAPGRGASVRVEFPLVVRQPIGHSGSVALTADHEGRSSGGGGD